LTAADTSAPPVAIVTGGARGIGRDIAARLIQDGHVVVLADVLTDLVMKTAKDLGTSARGCTTDVSSSVSVNSLIENVMDVDGKIDVLVNNASVVDLPATEIDGITDAEWDKVLGVNLTGTFNCCRAVTPIMREARTGSIINISSDLVLSGIPGLLHYTATKGGVVALTRALASEVGADGVRVNSIAPGFTETDAALEFCGDAVTRSVERRAIPRAQQPSDLVGTVSWLASVDSEFVTGQLIAVNGGYVFH
jgi:NAD(P)-dependent dehydrogenase (short-subunit alcohol dehydrogenase family)